MWPLECVVEGLSLASGVRTASTFACAPALLAATSAALFSIAIRARSSLDRNLGYTLGKFKELWSTFNFASSSCFFFSRSLSILSGVRLDGGGGGGGGMPFDEC